MPIIPIPGIHVANFLTTGPDRMKLRADENYQLSIYVQEALNVTGKIKVYLNSGTITEITVPPVTVSEKIVTFNIVPQALGIPTATIYKVEVWMEVDGIIRTEVRTFVMDQTSCPDAKRIKWLNKLGGVDAYTFTGGQTWQIEVEKNRAVHELTFPFNPTDRGITTSGVTAIESCALFSAFETSDKIKWLLEIISSPYVWILETVDQEPGIIAPHQKQSIPINVTNTGQAWKNQDELIQVKIEFTYGNPAIIQNG